MIATPNHTVRIFVDGKSIEGFTSYTIESSINGGANRFQLGIPLTRDVWDLCVPDSPVKVTIDGVPMIVGFIDERLVNESNNDEMQIFGRDKIGRLVNESTPSLDFRGLKSDQLVAKVAAPWFTKVLLNNDNNRNVQRGKGKKARSHARDAAVFGDAIVKAEPGQTRWEVIEQICEQTGMLCWGTADGSALILGKPNYDQESQFTFFQPEPGSRRASESTVIGLGVRDSIAERYSRILVSGSGIGSTVNYGSAVASRYGEAKNNATTDGDGKDFRLPKRLVVQRTAHSLKEAAELARREMARRDAQGFGLTVVAPGHGQVVAGAYTTIFAPDTMAWAEDERTGTAGPFLITSCSYRGSRSDGEQTTMALVRKGAELTT